MAVPIPSDDEYIPETRSRRPRHSSPPFFAHFCNVSLCDENAELQCEECDLRFCTDCVDDFFSMSSAYLKYDTDQHQFICIYCFIEELDQ